MRLRRPIPKKMQDAPELMLGLELYFSAFLDLNTERDIGMGEGPIPWGSINRWAGAMELSEEQTMDLHHHVVHLDTAYRKYHTKKGKKAQEQEGLKSGKSQAVRTPHKGARR